METKKVNLLEKTLQLQKEGRWVKNAAHKGGGHDWRNAKPYECSWGAYLRVVRGISSAKKGNYSEKYNGMVGFEKGCDQHTQN